MNAKFTQVLIEKLSDKNLSAISKEIGVPKTVLHDWVKGKRLPSVKNIHLVKKLADYLGMTLEEILLEGQLDKGKRIISSVQFVDEKNRYEIIIQKIK